MKKVVFILSFLSISSFAFSQILIDDGPIIVKNKNRFIPEYVIQGNSWDHRILTYWFANGTNDIEGDNERVAIRTAMSIWENQTDIFFLEVCDSSNADIIILWGVGDHGCGYPFDGNGGILAHAFYPPPNGNFAGDIHFDDDEAWTTDYRNNSSQPLDIITIAAHEIGHSLGLQHSTVTDALMYPYYNGSHRYLHQDDIAGIRSIYGNPGTYNYFSGPTLICSNGSAINFNNIPPSSTIQWTCGPYLTRVSAQGSNPCTFASTGSGSSWIIANIYTACSDTITLPHYNVWSGVPQVQITGPSSGCFGSEYTFYANCPQYSNPTSFEWSLSPEYWCNTIYGYDWWANAHFDCPYEELYQVRCTPQNACGVGNMANTYIYIYDCGYGYSLSPNPASTEVTVTVTRTDNINVAVNDIFNVSIYDGYGVKYFQGKCSGDRFTIPVYNLKNGNYILKIDNGKSVVNKQLIIMH